MHSHICDRYIFSFFSTCTKKILDFDPWGPKKFFVGPQSFFWVKYFCTKGKIFVFWAKYRNLGEGGVLVVV
jgi:hypothetical protein